MKKWEAALQKFLDTTHIKPAGVLVCGSFVTGGATKFSDIDVHLVLPKGTTWRERGNKIVDGFLIEYFANPPEQIKAYFKDDFAQRKQENATQFCTGKVLYDDGTIDALKKQANVWIKKPFAKMDATAVELNKYIIWDMIDNVEGALQQKDFWNVYHFALKKTIDTYVKYIPYTQISPSKPYAVLNDKKQQKKYLLPAFPDARFKKLASDALTCSNKKQAIVLLKKMRNHMFKKMGGFKLDGWKVRTPLDI